MASHEPPTTAATGPCEVHERAPGRNAYRTNLQVRSGGRGIRTHEELAPLAVFKTAAIGH
jgi:hypothetical protein